KLDCVSKLFDRRILESVGSARAAQAGGWTGQDELSAHVDGVSSGEPEAAADLRPPAHRSGDGPRAAEQYGLAARADPCRGASADRPACLRIARGLPPRRKAERTQLCRL